MNVSDADRYSDESEVRMPMGVESQGKLEGRKVCRVFLGLCPVCGIPGILFSRLFVTEDLLFLGPDWLAHPCVCSNCRWLAFWEIGEPMCWRYDGCSIERVQGHAALLWMKRVSANDISEILRKKMISAFGRASLRVALRTIMDGRVYEKFGSF
jgi:hypothetical protein